MSPKTYTGCGTVVSIAVSISARLGAMTMIMCDNNKTHHDDDDDDADADDDDDVKKRDTRANI